MLEDSSCRGTGPTEAYTYRYIMYVGDFGNPEPPKNVFISWGRMLPFRHLPPPFRRRRRPRFTSVDLPPPIHRLPPRKR
eukprot:9494588-Pyramimonas_sp.AAC.1